MSGGSLLLLLLEPALLGGGGLAGGSLALNLDLLGLVGRQLTREVGLLGGGGSLGEAESVDVALGVAGLDGSGLVGLELTEVEVLDLVGWNRDMRISDESLIDGIWVSLRTARRILEVVTYRGGQRRSGRCGEQRQGPVAERHG